MKRLYSLFLIAILLLNVLGYYGVFVGLEYRNDLAMLKKLDADSYDESQTVTIKIPLAIPYMTGNSSFQRVDGKFEHEGESYRLVKQMYSNDTLTVVCIRDVEHQRIDQALSSYVKTFADQDTDRSTNSKVTISFTKDYLPQTFTLKAMSSGWEAEVVKNCSQHTLTSSFMASIVHPPERA